MSASQAVSPPEVAASLPNKRTPASKTAPLESPQMFKNYEEGLTEFNRMFCYVRTINAVVRLSDFEIFAPQPFASTQYVNWKYGEEKKDDEGGKPVTKYQPIARKWLKDGRRNQCDRMTYAPGKSQPYDDGALNRWKGFASSPKEGDISPWKELLDFLFQNAPDERKYFEQWIAYPLQHPGAKLKTAVVVYSRVQGIGKNILVEAVEKIYGEEGNAKEIGDRELYASFNSWLRDRQFIVGDEAQGERGKRTAAEHLKRLITSPFVEVNEKHKPQYSLPNVANYIFLTNNPDPFYIAAEDRRFWIWEIPQREPLASEFYVRFHDWKESSEGIAALHYHLLQVDTGDFNPDAKAPTTAAKDEMIELGRSEVERWLRELPDSGGCRLFTVQNLLTLWHSANEKSSVGSAAITRALKTCGYRKAHGGKQIKVKGKQIYLWVVAPPDEIERLHALEPSELAAEYEGWNPFPL